MNPEDAQKGQSVKLTMMHFIARMVGIIIQPRKTLSKVPFERGGWFPIILVALTLGCYKLILLPGVLEKYNDPSVLNDYAIERGITEVEAKKELEIMRKSAPIITFIESPFLVVSGVGIITLILLLVGNVFYKTKMPFIMLFRTVAWATVVSVIPIILSIPFKLMNNDYDLPSNLGFLFSAEFVGGFFHQIFETIDFFMVWEIWLISIGLSVLYKISFQRALNTVGTMFVVFVVINVFMLESI